MGEELNRISLENKKLTEMLTVLCQNYNALEAHVKELASENELILANDCLIKKRKAPPLDGTIGFTRNTTSTTAETSFSDEESYKRPMDMSSNINLKISRVCVPTDVSDTRLVSPVLTFVFINYIMSVRMTEPVGFLRSSILMSCVYINI